jgi:hypothetical protein
MPGEIVKQGGRFERTARSESALAGQLPQEFLLIHAVLEGFAAIDENNRDFVVELAAKVGVGVNVDLMPGETPAARKL